MEASQIQGLIEIGTLGAIVTVVFVIGTTIVTGIAFYGAGPEKAKIFSDFIDKVGAIQLITVLNIVVAVATLTFVGKISSEGAVSVFSGIAGYVLGGIRSTSRPTGRARNEENSN